MSVHFVDALKDALPEFVQRCDFAAAQEGARPLGEGGLHEVEPQSKQPKASQAAAGLKKVSEFLTVHRTELQASSDKVVGLANRLARQWAGTIGAVR